MARGTQARFAKHEKSVRAGALAALIIREGELLGKGLISVEEMRAEVEVLYHQAQEHNLLDLVMQIVNGVPRLPPEQSQAERNYSVLDRLHVRFQAMLRDAIRQRGVLPEGSAAREDAERICRDIAEESDSLGKVLTEVKAKAHAERLEADEAAERAERERKDLDNRDELQEGA